jgi:hypothetical protein
MIVYSNRLEVTGQKAAKDTLEAAPATLSTKTLSV